MPRDHVEFLDPTTRSWSADESDVFPAGTTQKTLSRDPETGESTRLISIPAGATMAPAAATYDAELFVVDGGLRVDGTRLNRSGHAFVPADVPVSYETTDGARVLYMTIQHADDHPEPEPVLTRTAELSWEQPRTEGFPAGAARKSLYQDPRTGASTWLLGVLAHWRETRLESHPVVEEAYQVQGTMESDQGHFSAGKYFWRPPDIPHGPFSTSTGCLTFFRTDGPLETEYVADTADDW
ncbi:DUF4437 domain-containing protein [Halovivax limisalsi]|uniref:DUF4437 domain-containing protein n=1 Tax=Halovivax limisalsi TaxID=1453760 RepID=UPI001FFC8CC3|nr:DUF4437 domain-containing protein [Halovivax limisalsi]